MMMVRDCRRCKGTTYYCGAAPKAGLECSLNKWCYSRGMVAVKEASAGC